MWHGPYLQLTVRCEMAGVWPLRIPDIETVLRERLLPTDTARRRGRINNLHHQRTRLSIAQYLAFPADCPHRTDCHLPWAAPYFQGVTLWLVPTDTRGFQHLAGCTLTRHRVEGQTLLHAGHLP